MTAIWNQPYALTSLITSILATLLGAVVLWKNSKSPAARWWAIMCLFVGGWAFWNTFSLLSPTEAGALRYLRIADATALFIPITYLHFAMHMSGRMKPALLKIGYGITGLLALTTGSPGFVREGQKKFGIWFEVGGPWLFLFALIFVIFSAYGTFLLYQAFQKAHGREKAQFACLIFACALGFGGGFMWFPPAFGIDIPPLGGHIVALYCVVVAYAIVRYQFLDIQVVIRRSLVYSILVTLLSVGYFGAIYLIERAFQTQMGYRSPGISVAAFALMALLFQPLKIGIQRLVDWLIFRAPHEEMVQRMERLEQQTLEVEKFKAVSTLAAGMAHEIKNPLTALKTFGEFIPEKGNDPEFRKKLYEIFTTETQHIQNIVQEILEFAKPKPPRFTPVAVGPLIHSTVDLLSGDLSKRRIRWTIACRHAGATLQADPDQLRQILINLIQNAAAAMPDGGTLTLTTQANDGCLELAIADTGGGIPKELLPKIFDPFVTTKPNGTGLGLAMVQTLVRAHHGSIFVTSAPARGTIFTLRFPL